MKITQGDLIHMAFDGQFDIIVHGCNCLCNMGAGIAAQIKKECPEAFAADLATTRGDRNKLGTITYAEVQAPNGHSFTVVNAYTQYAYGRGTVNADYAAIEKCFREIKKRFPGKRVGIPLIGAGLAGGDWGIISKTIDTEMAGEDVTLVEFVPNQNSPKP